MTMPIYVAGWTLVHFVWQGTMIALVAALVLRLLRDSEPTLRYGVACTGLTMMIAAPLLTAPSIARTGLGRPDVAVLVSQLSTQTAGEQTLASATTSAAARGAFAGPFTVDAMLPMFVVVWLAGVAFLLARLAGGAWRVHLLHRRALAATPSRWRADAERVASRLGLRRRLHVVDSATIDTPTVVGWLRPVILLPIAALTSLTPAQVEAILAHELAHVRRHDYLVNLLQTIAETLLFYHPAVWWLSSRIRAEREHCCDDVAVQVCGDPLRYAEALTELAAWSTTHAPLAVAATSGSLIARVRRILRTTAPSSGLSRQGVAVAVTAIVFLGAGLTLVARTQVPAGDVSNYLREGAAHGIGPRDLNRLLGYELFPTRQSLPSDDPVAARAWGVTVSYPGGRMPFLGFTARGLIRYAYNLGDLPVIDGPSWIDAESLSITAATPAVAPDEDDWRLAVRTVLEERLHLLAHREARDFPVYALVLANSTLGPNVRPAEGRCLTPDMLRAAAAPGLSLSSHGQGAQPCGIENSFFGPTGHGATTTDLARWLRNLRLGRDVVDRTGLSTKLDYSLQLGPLPLAAIATMRPALARALAPLGVVPIHQALEEQLGLKLEETTASYDVFVIDRADRPDSPAAVTPVAVAPPATTAPRLVRAPWAGVVQRFARFAAAPAQIATGSMTGIITDQLNNFLPGVRVTLTNASTNQQYEGTTGRSGDFSFTDLPVGRYTYGVSLPGFRDSSGVSTIEAGANSEVNLVMAIGMIQETITVINDGLPPKVMPTYRRAPIPPIPPQATPGIGGNLRPPAKLRHVSPIYPASGVEGVVILTAVIDADGYVSGTRALSSPDADLTQAAIDAINQWEFNPTLLDGIPVDTLMQVTVSFRAPK